MTTLGLFPLTDPAASALDALNGAIRAWTPTHVFALFSGGHDSLCASHIASRGVQFDGCAHINPGIGIPETREFVMETCRTLGWPIREYRPPVSYEDIVLEHGFPGPAGHSVMYARLKERCLRVLVRQFKRHRRDRIMLVTGVRREESIRRMGHVEPVRREGAKLWVAPIIDWASCDKNRYIAATGLRRNEVVDLLCMSGECLCGAFARPGEILEVERWYPSVAARIHALEVRCRERGVHAVWGTRPPPTPPPNRPSPARHVSLLVMRREARAGGA